MSNDDKKLPAVRRENVPADPQDQEPSRMTTLGRYIRGQLSRVDQKSLERTTGAVDAYTDFEIAKGELADAKTETDRKIARYRYDRDKLIARDRRQTDHELELEEEQRRRDLAAARAQTERALDDQVRSRATREFSEELAPLKKQRGVDMFKTGNVDVSREFRAAQAEFDGSAPDATASSPSEGVLAGLEQAKARLQDQIRKAEARQEDATHLIQALGQLQMDIDAIKNQPG
jgi:hypothetical protein